MFAGLCGRGIEILLDQDCRAVFESDRSAQMPSAECHEGPTVDVYHTFSAYSHAVSTDADQQEAILQPGQLERSVEWASDRHERGSVARENRCRNCEPKQRLYGSADLVHRV